MVRVTPRRREELAELEPVLQLVEAGMGFLPNSLFALARDAAAHPPAVDDAHFEALRRHFDEDAIVELVAVVALFGFLNRFNDTMATTLEEEPLAFARARLAASGWEAGPHAPEEAD